MKPKKQTRPPSTTGNEPAQNPDERDGGQRARGMKDSGQKGVGNQAVSKQD